MSQPASPGTSGRFVQHRVTANAEFDPAEGHPNRRAVLWVANLSLVLVVVAVSSLNVAIPSLIRDLDPSPTALLWIVDIYPLVFAGFLLPAGALGDRFGRRRALLFGLIVFGSGTLLASLAGGPTPLIACRAVMGLGAAFVMPSTLSVITSVFPPRERAKAIAAWAGFAGAGGALGPLLSGLMLESYTWHSVFLINAPIVLVAFAAVTVVVPESRDPDGTPLDPGGALLSMGALGLLLFGIIQGPEHGWVDPLVVGSTAAGLVVGGLFVAYEARATHPMLDPSFFRIRAFSVSAVTITSGFFAMFGMFFILSQYFQFVLGYSPLHAGIAQLPAAVVMVILSPRSPVVVQRLGVRRTVFSGMLFIIAGLLAFAQVGPTTPYLLAMAGLVLMATGMALTMPATTAGLVGSLPPSKAGVGSAVNDTTREVGGALGIAVMGSVLTSVYRSSLELPAQIPDAAAAAVNRSVGAALEVAKQAPPEFRDQLSLTARSAFADGAASAFSVAAGLMAVVAAFIWFRATDDTAAAAHFHVDPPTEGDPQQVASTPGAANDADGTPST
ncbi:MAG: DHA2 family efflux MFS transporter permease subunit [Microthrixaceae bacterium]